MNAIKKNEVSMFKVGESVVLKNSSQNKVMKIQAYKDEFIRAYWSKKEYSFAHESNFRHATEQEIAAEHRIDHFVDANNMVDANAGVTVITPKGTSKVKGGMTAFVDMGDDSHIENHVSPLCHHHWVDGLDGGTMICAHKCGAWK